MSELDKQARVSAAELDRLVDGELSETERRTLIQRLDAQPDGWRRCALAFLEAREWKQSLGAIASSSEQPESNLAQRGVPIQRAPGGTPAARRPRRFWVAVAAVVAVAFGTGLGAGALLWQRPAPGDRVARQTDAPTGRAAQNNALPRRSEAAVAEPAVAEQPVAEYRIAGFVRLGGDGESAETVPIVSGPGLDEAWARALPGPLSENEKRRLEEEGWQVEQERRLLSVGFADQRVVIPIDSLRYRYVGLKVY